MQSKKLKKGSEKGGAVSANVASERSTKQEVRSKNAEARVNERQKVMFGTLGYGPRAQSVLHCHGVLALRQGPWKSRFGPQFLVGSESNVWHSGLRAAGPIRPSLPWCLSPARGSLDRSRAAQKPAARQRRPVLHCHGVLALRQGPWTPAWTAAVAGKVTVWTSVSCRFRK